MSERKSCLSPYHALLVIGTAMKHQEHTVHGAQFMGKERNGHAYGLLKKMVDHGLLENAGQCAVRVNKCNHGAQNFHRVQYRLTDKGRRFGERYNAAVIAENPPLVPYEEFE